MRDFLDGLNDDDRLLIELRAFSGDTWEDIAEQIGIEPASARQRGSRLMKKAQKILTTEEALNDQRA
jgi:RNA polymerase sigma factor (sigma-70 family)